MFLEAPFIIRGSQKRQTKNKKRLTFFPISYGRFFVFLTDIRTKYP